MDDFALPAEPLNGSQKLQVLVIIEHQMLARTCILSILKRELSGFEIVEMASTSGMNWLSGRDVRLIALNIGNKDITDPSVEDDLALLAEFYPNANVALLSNHDDEATASAAIERAVRGFFPTSIPLDLPLAQFPLALPRAASPPFPTIPHQTPHN